MHWARPLRPGRGHRDVGLQCHPALGTGSGSRLTYLGIHGTHVCCSRRSGRSLARTYRISGSDFGTRTLRNILLRINFELLAASSAAEIIGLALVHRSGRSFAGIDSHSANYVLLQLAGTAVLHWAATNLNRRAHAAGLIVGGEIFLRIILKF